MFAVNITRTIHCPTPDAFAYLSNFENDPQWWTGVLAAKRTSTTAQGVGTTFWQLNRLMGVRFPVTLEVTAYEPNQRISVRSTSGLVPFSATYLFESVTNGTRFTLLSEVEAGGWLFKLAGPVFRRYLEKVTARNFDNLKVVLEKRAAGQSAGSSS